MHFVNRSLPSNSAATSQRPLSFRVQLVCRYNGPRECNSKVGEQTNRNLSSTLSSSRCFWCKGNSICAEFEVSFGIIFDEKSSSIVCLFVELTTAWSTWKSTKKWKTDKHITSYRPDATSGRLLSWCRFTSEMIWAKILQGKYWLRRGIWTFHWHLFCSLFSLNQSLQWTFYERTATALYDFTPREPNQLPLKKGCLIRKHMLCVCVGDVPVSQHVIMLRDRLIYRLFDSFSY